MNSIRRDLPHNCNRQVAWLIAMTIAMGIMLSASWASAQLLVLEDALQGSTLGTQSGGSFVSGGWRVDDQYDAIYWHIPTLSFGAVEFDVRGLNSNEGRAGMEDKTELFHMYDYTFGNADVTYNGGYRDDPYKHFIRKIGSDGGTTDALEIVWQVLPNYQEPDTSVLSWNAGTTYRFREEWRSDGAGNTMLKTYRDGALLMTTAVPGGWNPIGHSVRIAAAPPSASDRGAPIDAIYSNLKVWDLSNCAPPPPPPRNGMVALNDHAFQDDDGTFLGLGASYFQALYRTKYDRDRYRADLAFLAGHGFNYIRTLSMVGGNAAWVGKEIAPVSFTNSQGQTVQAWSDYWQQFRDMIDIAYDEYGIRTQITIFADAQWGMPGEADRIAHMQNVLDNLADREEKVILLEVANEYWQNGFPDPDAVTAVREFGQYLADRTDVLVALSSTNGTNQTLEQMYQNSAADVATEHFTRDIGTVEGGWLPVREPWRVNSAVGVPPVISNEPIGPGSSVNTENDPIKLVSAAAFAYMAGLPSYVYHTNAGVFGNTNFQDMAGATNFKHLTDILPGDIANWQHYEGKEGDAPFVTYADGQANKWWTEISNPTSGVVRNTANVREREFYTLPIGILSGGVELAARQNMTLQAFNPLTGEVVFQATPSANEHFTLPQGSQAYIIRGLYAGDGPAQVSLGAADKPDGLLHVSAGDGDTIATTIGGRDARRNDDPNQDFYFYFSAADWFTHEASDPSLYITVTYFDTGAGALVLQYDSDTGNTLPAFYKNDASVNLTGTNTWKQHTFHVTDAYFGNRQNYGADFRIFGGVGNTFYLNAVAVSTIPEPASLVFCCGLGGVILAKRCRHLR